MEHPRNAQIVNEHQLAGRLGGNVDARHRLPDDRVGLGGLDLNRFVQLEPDDLIADQFTVADAAVMAADQAIFDGQLGEGEFKPVSGACEEELPGLRGRLSKRNRRDLNGLARDGRTLVGADRGVAEHDDDARKGHVEFFGDDLSERGTDARSEVDMAIEGRDRSIGRDLDERFEFGLRVGRCQANDRQDSPRSAILRKVRCHQSWTSTVRPAARITARRISRCAPQRQRL